MWGCRILSVDDRLALGAHGQAERDEGHGILGALYFSTDTTTPADFDIPCLIVPSPRLDRAGPGYETWLSDGRLISGEYGDVRYRHDGEFVFGTVVLDEDRFVADAERTPLQQATESAYRQVFRLLDQLDMPHPCRFWNYLPEINAHSHGLERYRQFNSGRQAAFLAHGRAVHGNLPAACALGTTHGTREALNVAFLAGRVLPQGIENPRQVSAFNYPSQYGPRSPTFSRATLVDTARGGMLLISGTASIVGHETCHPGDVAAQTRETLLNIEALIAEANRRTAAEPFGLNDLYFRVYLRRPGDLASVRTVLAQSIAGPIRAVYLQADICRADLLVEIEATAMTVSCGGGS